MRTAPTMFNSPTRIQGRARLHERGPHGQVLVHGVYERGPRGKVLVHGVYERGLTLVELIVTVAILSILASAAVPIARFQVKRQNERELRRDLWMMRDAIDKYKDAADKGAFQTKVDSQNYPPDLETLVNGVDVQGKKLKFLRHIPVDPMTGKAEWGLRSMQDDPTSDSYGGQSVFDVHSKSQGTALDGTKYSTW